MLPSIAIWQGRGAGPRVVAVCVALVAIALALQAALVLPVPFGDPVMFLAAAHHYCASGFFGTSLYPIDPGGLDRYVWHGPLSPLLHRYLNPSCSLAGYYLVALGIKASSAWLVWKIGQHNRMAPHVTGAVILVVLAAQGQIGFRPESLAIALMLAAEYALLAQRRGWASGLITALAWTQPTVFGLYFLFIVLLRPSMMRSLLSPSPIALSVAVSGVMIAVYPFPLVDLLSGILRQASINAGRVGEPGFLTFYGFSHFLPGWAIAFLVALICLTLKKPALLALWPFLWWFGPRVPPTHYNLIALLPILSLYALASAHEDVFGRWQKALFFLLIGVALGGLGQLFLRDALTVTHVGNGVREARLLVEGDLNNPGVRLGHVDGIVHLLVGSGRLKLAMQRPGDEVVSYYMVSGQAQSPCPSQSPDFGGLSLAGVKLYSSTAGWQLYRCEE